MVFCNKLIQDRFGRSQRRQVLAGKLPFQVNSSVDKLSRPRIFVDDYLASGRLAARRLR